MKAHLLYRNRDFDWSWALQAAAEREAARTGRRYQQSQDFNAKEGLPWNGEALEADLSLKTLFQAMARDDDVIYVVAKKVILTGVKSDLDTISYRQAILQDCLAQPAIVRELYTVAGEAVDKQKRRYFASVLSRYPDAVLRDAIETMGIFLVFLRKLRKIADTHAGKFSSEGWSEFFTMLKRDLSDDYLALVEEHLQELRFHRGELISAKLGKANKGSHYVLHRVGHRKRFLRALWHEFFEKKETVYSFEIHPRDEAGAQALNQLRNRGIALAADALGQAAQHVRDFFGMLRAELAFYVGCINLHEELRKKGEPICLPKAAPAAERKLSFRGLYDAGLALSADRRVIGNDTNADGRGLIIITGPNSGGKSTYLRSVGLAQLMMQCGMFVSAESFSGSLCKGIFTHFRREEDTEMESGKFEEELSRMCEIIDSLEPYSMVLFNESFAATNEREGSEIAYQIISALLVRRVRALCVTHMYELAHRFYQSNTGEILFLRAGRAIDGARTYKLSEGEPLPTSHGEDLYRKIFALESKESGAEAMQVQAGSA